MKKNSGFTLIEMVVVLAVVAILGAILVPTVAKSINDAKYARAANETQVIGAAIASFYKDLGRWPVGAGANGAADTATRLCGTSGNNSANTTAPAGAAAWNAAFPATPTNAQQSFEAQLIRNTPGAGATGNGTYPVPSATATQELLWRGPYITEIKADPWGTRYECNAQYFWNPAATNAVWVLCAGGDRTFRTSWTQAAAGATQPRLNDLAGANAADDVGFRIQ